MPSTPAGRVGARLWSKAVDEGLFTGVTVFSFAAMFRDRMKSQTPEQRERRYRNIGDPERRDRYKSMFEEGLDSPYVFRAVGAYEMAFKGIDAALAGGSDWLTSTVALLWLRGAGRNYGSWASGDVRPPVAGCHPSSRLP